MFGLDNKNKIDLVFFSRALTAGATFHDFVRSYQDEVVRKLAPLRTSPAFDVVEYGALNYDPTAPPLPLLAVQSKPWDPRKPCVLVTGGVHGYETSGVQVGQVRHRPGAAA